MARQIPPRFRPPRISKWTVGFGRTVREKVPSVYPTAPILSRPSTPALRYTNLSDDLSMRPLSAHSLRGRPRSAAASSDGGHTRGLDSSGGGGTGGAFTRERKCFASAW